MVYLFGFPDKVYSLHGRYSEITVDSYDNALYIAAYPHLSVSLHLDYFGRVPRREIEFYLDDDVIIADFIKGSIRWLKSNKQVDVQQERDLRQRLELKYFLSIENNLENNNTIEHVMQVLRLARGMK